ncbi:heme ABC exporter ATP-binding protein CcmA [Rhizorhapis sp. SPR117]|uniref:heme ABC exporter ATP-binding protein CcmA n=1 Tax=Rhizorhapis sp. SPR117 TaxID=2912611 RepID=UPI001F011F9F|nr:heme ABC exporter ATP-binding protein CcmA [Rhizorhapis sp. SPR117]
MMETSASLSFRAVACLRGDRLLFEGMDFTLSAGEAALVAGPNGTGKSSLIRLAAGLLHPAAGRIDRQGNMAMSDENLALDIDKPLHRALDFWARIDGSGNAALDEALAALSLDRLADVPVRMLSTGQRKRAMLARVIASGASIWLLDEPANGLDTASLELLGGIMQIHLAGGGIILAASHQPLPLIFTHQIALGAVSA